MPAGIMPALHQDYSPSLSPFSQDAYISEQDLDYTNGVDELEDDSTFNKMENVNNWIPTNPVNTGFSQQHPYFGHVSQPAMWQPQSTVGAGYPAQPVGHVLTASPYHHGSLAAPSLTLADAALTAAATSSYAASSHSPASSSGVSHVQKVTGACVRCRKQKMKCEVREGAFRCVRCVSSRKECTFEERKPRPPTDAEVTRLKIKALENELESLMTHVQEEVDEQTPLVMQTQKLKLKESQREHFKSVLSNTSSSRKPTAGQLADIKSLLDDEEWSSSGEDDTSEGSSDLDGFNGALPSAFTPFGIIARETLKDKDNAAYFRPGPLANQSLRALLIERGDDAPPIITTGLLTIDDVEILFDIYFKRLHALVSILDPNIHTPSGVLVRSPFLFTVICAITSRFLRFEPSRQTSHGEEDVYPLAMHFAKSAAASALVDGRKSVEMVQAFTLMSLYASNGKRFEESRTWFYSGVAMRLATDLNLHNVPTPPANVKMDERRLREYNNRVRTWLVCFNLDRCFAVQYGRPMALQEDEHVRNPHWYKTQYAISYDVQLHGHTDLLCIMARFHERLSAEGSVIKSQPKALAALIESFETEVSSLESQLHDRYREAADWEDEGYKFRLLLSPFVGNYSRLVILSHGLQETFETGVQPDQFLLAKALHAATAAVKLFVEQVADTGFIRYGPDCYPIYAAFSATFLMKVVDPSFAHQLDSAQKERIVSLVRALVHKLSSSLCAVDESHTAFIYSRFLKGLVKRVTRTSRSEHAAITQMDAPSSTSLVSDISSPSYSSSGASDVSSFRIEPITWEDVYAEPEPMTENDRAQEVAASWCYGDSWKLPEICPDVRALEADFTMNEF